MLDKLKAVHATIFENIVYDTLFYAGFRNLVWRTPGPDGGRDLEAELPLQDASGYVQTQRWYIECKRYSNTVSWPLIWEKLSYADVAEVDFLFLVTTGNISPTAETKIAEWNNAKRKPTIRVWRGYELEHKLVRYPSLLLKYGLSNDQLVANAGFLKLAIVSTKAIQSAYGASYVKRNMLPHVEFAAAMSELLTRRMADIEKYGKFNLSPFERSIDSYEWLKIDKNAPIEIFDRSGIRGILCILRLLDRKNTSLDIVAGPGDKSLSLAPKSKLSVGQSTIEKLQEIGVWSDIEISQYDGSNIFIKQRVGER